MDVQVGCSGWYYSQFKGEFYPEALDRKAWLPHYAARFSTVEINSTFYHWPRATSIAAWRRAVPASFRFTVKAHQSITHVDLFRGTESRVRDVYAIGDALAEEAGCFLFQLPASVKYDPELLARMVGQLSPERRNVVEFRSKTWWNDDVFSRFREAGITFCSPSCPSFRDELIVTSPRVYLRFHGKKRWYRHEYTAEELETWAQRVEKSGAREVWAYFNNTMGSAVATRNAIAFRERLQAPGQRAAV